MEACEGQHKAHGYCLRHYRQHQRGGVKHDTQACAACGGSMAGKMAGAMYCSGRCKQAGWAKANPGRKHNYPSPPPKLCAYFTGYCGGCGCALGGRRAVRMCSTCTRTRTLEAGREAALAMNVARHKATGKVVRCDECAAEFCPVYGAKHGATPLCVPCAAVRRRRWKADGGNNVQRAKRAGVPYRYFNERKVLERDGWTCQLCGIQTPKEARGSTRPDAPEFDHCVPLALGGPHLPENGQCLCRTCNGAKADRWCARSVAAAFARGLSLPQPVPLRGG